jgi:hypothetical protein
LILIYWLPPWAPLKTAHDIAWKRGTTIMLAFVGYILLAWYDTIYDCNDRLHPTFLGWISSPFKPHRQRYLTALPMLNEKCSVIVMHSTPDGWAV